jgi:Ser/Thr protein kinase RdoA (MazF antagonist)
MSTLEEEMRDLKANIKGYEQEYANSSPEEKKELRPLITASTKTLTALLQQQSQAQAQAQAQGG